MTNQTTKTVHWPGQSIDCCDKHAAIAIRAGNAMGFNLTVEPVKEVSECINCVNEAKE